MTIHINKSNQNLNFTSGLNAKLVRQCKHTDVQYIQSQLLQKYIIADFDSSKSVAFASNQVLQIFETLKNKLKSQIFDISIPRIQVYLEENIIFQPKGYCFCVPETQKILKNELPFETGSIFFEKENSLEEVNQKLDESFQKQERSSSHFLAPFVHEFLHNSYINYIYKKYGYEGLCPYTAEKYHNAKNCGLSIMKILQTLKFNESENSIIREHLGQYATTPQNQYHEVFAETFTKLICNCLSEKDSTLTSNPIDELKKLPKEFLLIIQKLFI